MKSRQYQEEGIEQVVESVSSKRKVIRQNPTGAGKTVEFAMLAQRYIWKTGKSVLILVHREELMWQAKKTVKEICDIDACLITSGSKHYYISRVYIGMVESTVSRMNLFDNVGLVIVDECHIANFNKIHSLFLEELIIGYSATPISSNKKVPLNKFYNDIVLGPQIPWLISEGYLCQNITRSPADIVDATKFEIDKLKGDYNERQMSTEYKMPRHVMNVVRNYRRFCLRQKTLVFNVTIEHSIAVNECLVACGYNSRHLASNNESERHETLKWFHDTPDAILCNVMIATVGFDEPTVQNIIVNFATLSETKYIQCCGRGSRPIDDAWIEKHQIDYPYQLQPKNGFNIIDMGANWVRHGDWNCERDWARRFWYPHIPGDGIAPTKTCPECEGLVHAAARICTCKNEKGEDCLHEFERRNVQEYDGDQDMIIVGLTGPVNIAELNRKSKKKYEYYTFLELGRGVVKSMYQTHSRPTKEVQQRYFKEYYSLCCSWFNKTMAGKNGNMDSIEQSAFHIRKALNNFNDLIKKEGGVRYDNYQPMLELPYEDRPLLVRSKAEVTEEDNVYEW